jgi:small ligand-binding sensory domain FIST
MEWASAVSSSPRLDDALEEATTVVASALDHVRPDLLVVFVAPQYGPDVVGLPRRFGERFPGAALIGCTGGGVIGDGREIEQRPALSVTGAVLPGVDITTFHLSSDARDWPEQLPIESNAPPSFVVLPEPFSCDAQELIRWFDRVYPYSVKIGGLASGAPHPGSNALFATGHAYAGGAVGVALCGDIEIDTVVAQGCRPIGAPLFITRSSKNAIYQLDGRPPVDVLEELFIALPEPDRELFRHSLFLGVVMQDAQEQYGQGDFLIRNLIGVDGEAGAILVGTMVRDRQVVQFHLRDARTSAEDLDALLGGQVASPGARVPAGALLFSCLGRGRHLYGRPDHDTDLFRAHYGAIPLGGFFCNGEIGPVQGQTFLHGYTSSFGLFRPKRSPM